MARSETKARMVSTAAELFQRDGYHATSWRGLVETAGTPWGSAYHHFPGGKEQLAVAAVEAGAGGVAAFAERCFEQHDLPGDAVRAWFAGAARSLHGSGYRRGCPVATLALETVPASAALTSAVGEAIGGWTELLAQHLVSAGITPPRAAELASLVIVNLEGALVLSRVGQSTEPLRLAGAEMARILQAELP